MAKDVRTMTGDELTTEWLACEREQGDPMSSDSARQAASRQVEIEREQSRREAIRGEGDEGDDYDGPPKDLGE